MNKDIITYKPISEYVRAKKVDPIGIFPIQKAFTRELMKRFDVVAKLITKALVENDVFGMKSPTAYNIDPGPGSFDFPTSEAKMEEFMRWLKSMIDQEILGVRQGYRGGSSLNKRWTNLYIHDSYKKGVIRARYQLGRAGYPVPTIEQTGGIDAAMMGPVHMDRVGILYMRTFNDLKAITDAMDNQISRVLAQGMSEGDNPRTTARKMNAVIKGGGADLGITDTLGRFIPAKRRAEMLARTETVRAHHLATIQEYRNYALDGIYVEAEWSASKDKRVCPKCAELQGHRFTLDEIEPMIPVHPNCRCSALPVILEHISEEDKKKADAKVKDDEAEKKKAEKEAQKKEEEKAENKRKADAKKKELEKAKKTTEQLLQDIEKGRIPENIEYASLVTPDGEVLWTVKGCKGYVQFTDKQLAMMKGNILTHNHPSWYRRGWDVPFSADDIALFKAYGLAEIRASGGKGYFSIKINDNVPEVEFDVYKIYARWERILDKFITEQKNRFKAGEITREQLLASEEVILSETSRQLAEELGFSYNYYTYGT